MSEENEPIDPDQENVDNSVDQINEATDIGDGSGCRIEHAGGRAF